MMKSFLVACLVLLVGAVAMAGKPGSVLPADWRSWNHVKGMAILDKNHGLYGFHHVYVEPKGISAFKAGKGYPNGTILAVPFYEVVEGSGTVSEGPLMKIAYMKRDNKATETGGWIFGAVDPSGKSVDVDAKACFQCHEPRKARDYVFSEWTP